MEILTIIVCGMFVLTYSTAPRSSNVWTRAEFDLTGPCSMNEVNPIVLGTPLTLKQSYTHERGRPSAFLISNFSLDAAFAHLETDR
jgi:hypothetical protein